MRQVSLETSKARFVQCGTPIVRKPLNPLYAKQSRQHNRLDQETSYVETLIAPADMTKFVEQFLMAVDFQDPVNANGDTRLDSLPEWDSLAALGVIVMCDTEYDVTITGNDLKASTSIGDIYRCVLAKRG